MYQNVDSNMSDLQVININLRKGRMYSPCTPQINQHSDIYTQEIVQIEFLKGLHPLL